MKPREQLIQHRPDAWPRPTGSTALGSAAEPRNDREVPQDSRLITQPKGLAIGPSVCGANQAIPIASAAAVAAPGR
jgi:hypothetical protein